MNSKKDRDAHHRETAVKCFNKTWDYLEKKDRSRTDDIEMLLQAHSSLYHWNLVGTLKNKVIGEWQVSRVYVDLKQPELALLFAKSALALCEENKLIYLRVSAYEGMARAYGIGGDRKRASEYLGKARKELGIVKDKEDRKIFGEQITETERLIIETPAKDQDSLGSRSTS